MATHHPAPQDNRGAHATEALAHGTQIQDHHPREAGTMDITEQERTFAGFMRLTIRVTITIIVILILLALINA
ncbi:aa3-type cytochrome c oxidase subunit IV [Rubellimicrobium sp. CFH 75288]|uniref:aa3-type cytochrome c oxidase subunit IV n=1 Tax=Rubellimicrobium sp. CFH 75288 TaxID=2697034 RepID=UPI001413643C|nr:aa3-type cytochrome c oxidase subunit IV [Rubellimicrobium sp. CFH 75288]